MSALEAVIYSEMAKHADTKPNLPLGYLSIYLNRCSVVAGTWAMATDASQTIKDFDENSSRTLWGNTSSQAQNDEINFYGISLPAGTYTFYLAGMTLSVGGIATIILDGTTIGTIDFYSASTTYNVEKSITGIILGETTNKKLQIKMATKNGSSSAYDLRVSSCKMWRTA